jgi:aspartyl-tRNA(Asn)/glutamyl-tRNA(Gln) amidotransferase subunit A
VRILRGSKQDAADYIELCNIRANFIERVAKRIGKFDAVLMPTTPITAPALSDLVPDEAYLRINALVLRNPSIVNFIDGCAISIPCQEPSRCGRGGYSGNRCVESRDGAERLLATWKQVTG